MIVGEAPGRTEDRDGIPFVGASGKLLDSLLTGTPLNRRDAYVTNVVHCWPPYSGKQAKPGAKAIKACRRFLEREIEAVNPDVIVTLGATPLQWFFPGESIKAVHGQRLDWNGRTVIAQYHPAASMHNPKLRPVIEADFRSIGEKLDGITKPIRWRVGTIQDAEEMIRATYSDLQTEPGATQTERDVRGRGDNRDLSQDVSLQGRRDDSRVERGLHPSRSGHIAFDFETTDLRPHVAQVVGFSLAAGPLDGIYVRVAPDAERPVLRRLCRALSRAAERGVRLVAHNAGYESAIFNARIGKAPPLDDTMILARLAGKESIGLKPLALSELGIRMTAFTDVVKGDIHEADPMELAKYATYDAVATFRLWPVLWQQLTAREQRLYTTVEKPLIPAVVSMAANGIAVDEAALDAAEVDSEIKAAALLEQITALTAPMLRVEYEAMPTARDPDRARPVYYSGDRRVGPPESWSFPKSLQWTFNPSSPDAVQALLGLNSSDEAALLRNGSPLAQAIVEYRHERKFTSSYVTPVRRSLPRLRGSFNQVGTDTGRFSASGYRLLDGDTIGINLQTPPKRIKAALVADEGCVLVEIDYSQIELRVLAHLSQDAALLDAYRSGRDIHDETMNRAGVHDRRIAKILNFGTSYEPDDDSAAYVVRTAARKDGVYITKDDALAFVRAHRRAYPGVLEYYRKIDGQVMQRGFVETLLGRKYRVQYVAGRDDATRKANWELLRKAINHPVQGTAADIIKTAWVAMWNDGARPTFQWLDMIHDSFLLQCREADVDKVIAWAMPLMENAIPLDVPVECDVKYGKRWSELQ